MGLRVVLAWVALVPADLVVGALVVGRRLVLPAVLPAVVLVALVGRAGGLGVGLR
ncbi:hypothetical protein ACXJJ3_20090 [Kribbella sp. WER1]